jgi:PAS domain S-box-containing protein
MSPPPFLTSLLTHAAEAIVVTDLQWQVTEFAGRAEDLYECSREAAVGQHWLTFASKVFPPAAVRDLTGQLADGTAARAALHLSRPDDHWVDVDLHVAPLKDTSGQPTGWLAVARDVTGDRALELLRTREREMDGVFHALAQGIVLMSADGRVVGCNPAAERILGLTRAQMEGRTSFDPRWGCIHEDGTPYPPETHPSMVTLRTGVPVRDAVMGVARPDGTFAWITIDAVPLGQADSGSFAVAVTFTDITAMKQAEHRERDARHRLSLVMEGSTDGFWDWHIPSGHVTFSERWCEMLGYVPAEVEPDVSTRDRLVHPDDMPTVTAVLELHLRGDSPLYECEHRVRHRDGHWVWVLDRGKVVERDADGRPIRAAGTRTDITARKDAERRLHESEARLRSVMQALSEAVSLTDLRTGRLALVNRRYAEIAGLGDHELLNVDASEVLARVHPDDRAAKEARLQQAMAGEDTGEPLDYRCLVGDAYRWFSETQTLVKDAAGTTIGVVAVKRDITERQRTGEAIRRELADSNARVHALQHRTLAEFLPICMYCKHVGDEDGQWRTLEDYISAHTSSLFSHGLCPDCLAKFISEHKIP